MRLTLPDAANPNRSATYDFPDAVGERFVAWMLAIPLWQRTSAQLERKVQDLRLELDTLRQNGTATPFPPPLRLQVAQPEPVVAPVAEAGPAGHLCDVCGASFKMKAHLANHTKAKHAPVGV